MAKYRKKPVVIEALQFKTDENGIGNHQDISNFIGEALKVTRLGDVIVISTLEGDMECHLNDYVIKGVQGEFYPCKPDSFESAYEKVE